MLTVQTEELACRREYALYTLDSLQKHFINLYTSRQPQCKLGYGSSPQCDSYQLGEMIRFFSRKGLLRMDGAFAPAPEELEPYNGSLNDIIFKLKETPSYQIDTHHAHCGLRTRLIPILESLSPSRQVEMCLACWKNDKYHESWAENPTRGKCNFERMNVNTRGCHMHRKAKTLYTAEERNWTPINGL